MKHQFRHLTTGHGVRNHGQVVVENGHREILVHRRQVETIGRNGRRAFEHGRADNVGRF